MGVIVESNLPSDFRQTVQAYGDVGTNALQTVAGGIAAAAETRGIAAISDAFESFQAAGLVGPNDREPMMIGTPAGFPDPSVFMGAVEAERPAGLPDPSLSMGAVEAERQPFSDIVRMQDVLKNLTDPKFNAAAGLADFAQNVLGTDQAMVNFTRDFLAEQMLGGPDTLPGDPGAEVGRGMITLPGEAQSFADENERQIAARRGGILLGETKGFNPQPDPPGLPSSLAVQMGTIDDLLGQYRQLVASSPQEERGIIINELQQKVQSLQNLQTTVNNQVQQSFDLQSSLMRSIKV